MAPPANRHFAPAADADTGLKAITAINLKSSVAGVADIRMTSVAGVIVIPLDLAAGEDIHLSFASPLVCSDGTFYWDVTSGTWTGTISGY